MSSKLKTNLLKYGITTAVCLAVMGVYLWGQDLASLDTKNLFRVLCDSCFLPGFLSLASGLLIWLGNEGSFDGVGYALSHAVNMLLPGAQHKGETYKDYLARVRGKEPLGFSFLLIVGLVFIAVSMIFLALYNQY